MPRVNLSFKNQEIEEIELYTFLKEKAKLIGESGYIKTLLKEAYEKEKKKNQIIENA